MKRRGVVVEDWAISKHSIVLIKLLLLRIKDAETVIGGGIFFIKFQDSEEGFFGAKRFMVAHRSLSGAPKFFHLHIVAGGFWGFDGFTAGKLDTKRRRRAIKLQLAQCRSIYLLYHSAEISLNFAWIYGYGFG